MARDAGRLAGRRVIVTRARSQAGELARLLDEEGAMVVECPTIRFEDPPDWGQADASIRAIRDYDWVVFTSANGVERFFARLAHHGLDARALSDACVAAVGPATGRALGSHGITPNLLPEEYVAESLAEAMLARGVGDVHVLIPRALEAREVLPDELARRGAKVDIAPVYRTVREEAAPEAVREALAAGTVDAVTFTSASTVRQLTALFGPAPVSEVLAGVAVASIGPVTSEVARELGLKVAVEPAEHTVPALVDALAEHLGPRPEAAA